MFDKAKTFVRDLLRTLPLVPWFLLRLVLFKQESRGMVQDPIKGRALVILTNAIGDTVTALPALQCVVQQQRPMKVDVLVRPKTAPLFKFVPGVGDVVPLKKLSFPFKLTALLSNIVALRELRRRRYQSAIIFASNFWTAWVAFLVGAGQRYGFSRTENVGLITIRDFDFLLTHDKKEIKSRNYAEAHFEFLDWLHRGANEPRTLPQLKLDDAGQNTGTLADERPIVVLNPFASQRIREWPLEHWIELASALAEHHALVVLCCEAAQEKRLLSALNGEQSSILVFSDLGLEDFICLLSTATSVVTNDSGPLHLSYSLGKPSVAIFGPTDPDNVIPNGADVTVVRNQIECSPCVQLGSFERCPLTHHLCLREIGVDEVLNPLLVQLRLTELRAPVTVCSTVGQR